MGLKKPSTGGGLPSDVVDYSGRQATFAASTTDYDGTNIRMHSKPTEKTLLDTASTVTATAPLSSFGDATEADVAAGKTFTGAAGLFKTGSYVAPTLASLTADATAAAGDIASGKTAYVNGVKVTGAGKMDTTTVVKTFTPSSTSMYVTISYDNYLRITDKWNHVYLFSGHMAYYGTTNFSSNIVVWKENVINSRVTFNISYEDRTSSNGTVKIYVNGNSNLLSVYISKLEEVSL